MFSRIVLLCLSRGRKHKYAATLSFFVDWVVLRRILLKIPIAISLLTHQPMPEIRGELLVACDLFTFCGG
jgi:hypothetical protein